MRTSALLLLSLFVSAACVAADEPPTTRNKTSVALTSSEPSTTTAQLGRAKLQFLPKTDAVCLKLRTYIVQRVDPHSDATRLRSYSTCQPASKFETHNAVQHGTKPEDWNWSY
jgi:hypothetical protein